MLTVAISGLPNCILRFTVRHGCEPCRTVEGRKCNKNGRRHTADYRYGTVRSPTFWACKVEITMNILYLSISYTGNKPCPFQFVAPVGRNTLRKQPPYLQRFMVVLGLQPSNVDLQHRESTTDPNLSQLTPNRNTTGSQTCSHSAFVAVSSFPTCPK